ncbi:MAG: hypothetical protein KDD65_03475 [Bacteroidetes bacterium]|nr:hypothetical protein [Bacteroidota bacterium]
MSSSEGREWRTQPSVTLDKWIAHAKRKLEKGYRLVVSQDKRTANFYLPGKGYEMCDYKTARKLIEMGLIIEVKEHHLGKLYDLVADYEVMEEINIIAVEDEEAAMEETDPFATNVWDEEDESDGDDDDLLGDDGEDMEVDEDID